MGSDWGEKPKRGKCERCGANGGRLRRHGHGAGFVLCSACNRVCGGCDERTRYGRHKHGGKPGKVA